MRAATLLTRLLLPAALARAASNTSSSATNRLGADQIAAAARGNNAGARASNHHPVPDWGVR